MGSAPHGELTGISPLSHRGHTGAVPMQLGRGAPPLSGRGASGTELTEYACCARACALSAARVTPGRYWQTVQLCLGCLRLTTRTASASRSMKITQEAPLVPGECGRGDSRGAAIPTGGSDRANPAGTFHGVAGPSMSPRPAKSARAMTLISPFNWGGTRHKYLQVDPQPNLNRSWATRLSPWRMSRRGGAFSFSKARRNEMPAAFFSR